MRNLLLGLCLVGICLTWVGCVNTQNPKTTIFSGAYWKRHGEKIVEDFHKLRVDIDRIIFDLDERPLEDI